MHERIEMMNVQKDMADYDGVSAIVYVQTCAAEKRRRRKPGHVPGSRSPGVYQHGRVRRVRRLWRAIELCIDCSKRDGVGAQTGD